MRKYKLMRMTSHHSFTHVETIPYDIVHPMLPRSLIRFVQSIAFVFERAPLVRELCGTLHIWARKPPVIEPRQYQISLARHRELFGSTSVVVPSHNEEMNILPLVEPQATLRGTAPGIGSPLPMVLPCFGTGQEPLLRNT
jgi:hypothetical protein